MLNLNLKPKFFLLKTKVLLHSVTWKMSHCMLLNNNIRDIGDSLQLLNNDIRDIINDVGFYFILVNFHLF